MSKPYGEVNVDLFQKVKEKILEEPRRFDMSVWGNHVPLLPPETYPPCGTVACIAGWALLLESGAEAKGFDFCSPVKAAKVLALPLERRGEVFHAERWPDSFRARYQVAANPAEQAQVAADFIDYICGIDKPIGISNPGTEIQP